MAVRRRRVHQRARVARFPRLSWEFSFSAGRKVRTFRTGGGSGRRFIDKTRPLRYQQFFPTQQHEPAEYEIRFRMQTDMDPSTEQPDDWRWNDSREERSRDDDFAEDDDSFGGLDQPARPLEFKGPIHSPPEILRALSLWTELDEDEFSDFDDEDFDDEFDDDFEEELDDEYEELEDDLDSDDDEFDEDLDEELEPGADGDDDFDGALPESDDDEIEELDEE